MSAPNKPSTAQPKRVVVRLRVAYNTMTEDIVKQTLKFQGMDGSTDYCPHVGFWHEKMYLILDLYCKTHPSLTTAISSIPIEVFDARKPGDKFRFINLGPAAVLIAQDATKELRWGS